MAAPNRAAKYRGATVADLDPPACLCIEPHTPISHALLLSYERSYTHLAVTSNKRALLGYLSIPHLNTLLTRGSIKDNDPVSAAMQRFARRGKVFRVITLETPLEELEAFFEGDAPDQEDQGSGHAPTKQDFGIVTDEARRFVLGVATREDLDEFVRRRPA